MIAIHKDLNPKLVQEYNDDFELLVVEIDTQENSIRVISGYGPQENWDEEKRIPFFIALETEIEKAELEGRSIIVEIDANSKLGEMYIPNDPHEITPNGRLLAAIIERHSLILGNGSTNCTGTITRCRKTKKSIEKSVIDFLFFSHDLKEHFKSMHVDEERKHVLTKIQKTKKGTKYKESDHNVLLTEFKCEIIINKDTQKEEAYNLKNKECQSNFKKYTDNTKMLSSVLNGDGDVTQLTNRLVKKINGCIAMNFKKHRVTRNKPTESNHLYDKMRKLKGKDDDKSKDELKSVIEQIADEEETNYEKVKEALKGIKTGDKGLNSKEMWKIKKKLFPKSREPPSAMKDEKGNLLTSDKAILDLGLKTFKERLEPNQIEPNLEQFEKETNEVCEIRLKLSKNNKTVPWTMDNLKNVLKQLDNDKSRDSDGFANEIFKVAGEDLFQAVLKLMNIIKTRQEYPKGLENCNITTIHKKSSKKEFKNYRGVFRVAVLRSILDKLMYNDSYYTIDSNLTDGNVGARKKRSVRDNIFVMSAITNSIINGKSEPIQAQIMDINTCFDKLWLQACINALFEAGLDNDQLNLLYLENKNANIAVKVNNKLSARISVKNVIMQGTIWGSLKCTTTMDTLNKTMKEDTNLHYNYKGDKNIAIGVLGMVDDTLALSECGNKAIRKNSVVNSFVESQRLTLSTEKSVVVHIGKKSKCKATCPTLKIHKQSMKESQCAKYLGHLVSPGGGLSETIEDRRNKGWGKVSSILAILSELGTGGHRVEVGLMLRKAILVNSLLFAAESWSGVTDKQIARMEVVDTTLLRKILPNGHSKCPTEFHHLESGTLKLRHILTYLRLMYHHQILSKDNNETIKKIYLKQKEDNVKGDWYRLLLKDFEFLGITMDESEILNTPKHIYKKKIKELVRKAGFLYLTEQKLSHTKVRNIQYSNLSIQPYLTSKLFNSEETSLLYNLRSHCHPSKRNFRKMYKNDLKCRMGCNDIEDQIHIFTKCQPILSQIESDTGSIYEHIYDDISNQKKVISIYTKIEKTRLQLLDNLLPGGGDAAARTHVNPLDLHQIYNA